MRKAILSTACTLSLFLGQVAHANINVDFFESAPKDSFVLTNTSSCMLKDIVFKVDLTDSAGRLIFDTTAAGEGVEVFQPFEVVKGDLSLISSAKVNDGDKTLSLNVKSIAPNESVSFTIDLDDTLVKSELGQIRVSDSEIKGGKVSISSLSQKMASATFGSNANATLKLNPCAV